MIKKAIIKNYQSHKESVLEFSSGINIIIGESDQGKSGIFRSLIWNTENKPTGTSNISHWIKEEKKNGKFEITGETSVFIQTEKGTITRFRNKDDNGYKYDNGEIDKAIKTTLPDKVIDFFNLSELNTRSQHDPYFLIQDTPGKAAGFFNKILKLDDIGKYLKITDSKKRLNKQKVKQLQESIKSLEIEIDSMAYLADVENLIEKLDARTEKQASILTKKLRVSGICSDIESLRKEIIKYEKILAAEKILENLESLIVEETALETQYNSLSSIWTKINDNKSIVNKIDLNKAENLVEKLDARFIREKEIKNEIEDIKEICEKLPFYKDFIAQKEKRIEELTNKIPDICPLCGNRKESM